MPHPGDLAWSEGSVPTPHGPIDVSWRQGAAVASFRLTLDAPHGTSGSVWVPSTGPSHVISRDGRVVWRHGVGVHGVSAHTQGGYVVFERQAGSHTYRWSAAKR